MHILHNMQIKCTYALFRILVMILANCFESLRDLSLKYYGLDSAHYTSSPGLSWDAMLKCTEVELELLTDQDMLCMIMEGIRGGLSCIMKRYVETNNKYMINYDPTKESSYLQGTLGNYQIQKIFKKFS